jgi:predicted nuclease with TOPRIM domain
MSDRHDRLGATDEEIIDSLRDDLGVAYERISRLTAQVEAVDREWWVRLGKFRKALEAAGLHGHYNLLQQHFESEAGKWDELTAENAALTARCERLEKPVSEEQEEEVIKILGRAEMNGNCFAVTARMIINYLAARAAETQKEGSDAILFD